VYADHKAMYDYDPPSEPIAHGISSTPAEALADAERSVGKVQPVHAKNASWYRREKAAEKPRNASPNGTDTATLEFVHDVHWSYPDYADSGSWFIGKHRIVKKTQSRLCVECDPYRDDQTRRLNDYRDFYCQTFVLNRHLFETRGYADRKGSRGYWGQRYYADPQIGIDDRSKCPFTKIGDAPGCFKVLGIQASTTVDEVKSAFRRLSREKHPDHGGNADDFVRLREAYERALRACKP
jgi:hypothetical protein